ncbi:zinc dependent phospholipase C family protein [Clostridium sp. BNL1100]|uniref:zinc dependent phospholipase C family protein n=1 Tax=Clostridium sp. BNL1100 TaxID=755731 RepID=UPI00024A7531|nr:zinc dependent phospholipase C family protein [Clostridium sp. BNL1100]AEY67293.1 hypothetical protein Clo1100_3146 [Clostridium sp. BNL1100]
MPNLVTHYLCGLEAVKMIENKECKKLIELNKNVFNLGVQGPDILFYYGIWPWSPKTQYGTIGEKFHISKVNLVFSEMIDYILKQEGNVKDILTVYFMGFLSHNCLDSITHPYIFYKSGFKTDEDPRTNLYQYYHRRFETAIDVLMCSRLLNKKVHEIRIDGLIGITVRERNVIGDMYESVIASVFNYNIPGKLIAKAIKDMNTVEKILRDPHGTKKKFVAAIDQVIYGFPLFSSLIFPLHIKDGFDYLNLAKNEWAMPYDKAHKSTLSFIEMFKEACDRTQRFCQVLYSTITGDNSNVSYALKLFGNNSYTSGINCDLTVKFKYHDIIFEQHGV